MDYFYFVGGEDGEARVDGRILDGCAIFWPIPSVRGVLGFGRAGMAEAMEEFVDVPWHGDVDVMFVVVPCEGESAI